tara:strand:+ start:33 stop:710 length:678 start_codon:yes stop_codon:yes gene_type:complete
LTKRLTEKQKEEIIALFTSGKELDEISKKYNFTKLTISRNLKKILGDQKFSEFVNKNKLDYKLNDKKKKNNKGRYKNTKDVTFSPKNEFQKNDNNTLEEEFFQNSQFMEITPLNCDFESNQQKDLTSVHISQVTLPKIVYIIIDKKIELETKLLKDYPQWQFLSEDELKRKTIEIYSDIKVAKNFCGKEQKVIKVPNTEVFKIVSPILIAKGISRIVSSNKLVAL